VRKAGMKPGDGAEPEDVLGKRHTDSLDVERLVALKFSPDSSRATEAVLHSSSSTTGSACYLQQMLTREWC